MATTTAMDPLIPTSFSGIPFSIFRKDFKQYSLGDIQDKDTKAFVWHQFMLDVLLNIPRSPADNDTIIAASHRVKENDTDDLIQLKQADIDEFQRTYTSDKAIRWYTRSSFLYRAFNQACRTLNGDAIIQFHSFVKDLNIQLTQLHEQQMHDHKFTFPLTVYRGQATWDIDELEKLRTSQSGDLIAMNTFLSTTISSEVACGFLSGADKDSSVLFQITVNENIEHGHQSPVYANISQQESFPDEQEVLFGMSSVFRVISVEKHTCFWLVELELTSCTEDEHVQKVINEVKTYLYQISGKRLPFYVFKQLFTTTSRGHFRPFTELMKFFLTDLAQLFVTHVYKKESRMKELIDADADLLALIKETNQHYIQASETSICLLFDLLDRFLYSQNGTEQDSISFDISNTASLLCFGGFLLMTGEYDKGIRYFEMLLQNDFINDKLKIVIHALLEVCYTLIKQEHLVSEHLPFTLQLLQSSAQTSIPSWFSALIGSSQTTSNLSDPQMSPTLNMADPLMKKKQIDNDVNEKLRQLLLGHICSEQQNFVGALNHWEDALELGSSIPSSTGKLFHGVIYLQMAAAYLRLNNTSKALSVIEQGVKEMECYYSSTHRMFASLNLMYGYYLIQHERSSEGIERLKKALSNPYFSTDRDFLGVVYCFLIQAAMQSGDIDSAEQYCYKALEYQSPTNMTALVPSLLEVLPQLKMCVDTLGTDVASQFVGMSLQLGQQMLSNTIPNSNTLSDIVNDQTCTFDKFIIYADECRHREDYTGAETYYNKALETMTEAEANSMWEVYRKMMRMNSNSQDRYRDYFIEQCSKYDDSNPKHFEMIATLQIIMYKFCLMHNEIDLAFDCLIYGTCMAIKSFHHQLNIDANYIPNLLQDVFHHEQLAQVSSILTQSIQMYSNSWTMSFEDFLHTLFPSDDLYMSVAKIIHHSQIDVILQQCKSNYNDDDQISKSIFLFLDTLLEFIRRSMSATEKSILGFSDELLELARKYNDHTAPMFYLMKILESLLIDDTVSFSHNLDKLRMSLATLEQYKELKEKISGIFDRLEEDQLFQYLENIAKTR